jgi:hydroxymethylbilane synthase
MAQKIIRIGTRDSQLAVWQATLVQNLLKDSGVTSELVFIKSEGDVDTVTPLYALGVQGVFTKTLDAALLGNRIDIAVHSMKDVPTQLAEGIRQAAVLKRASHKDILVYKNPEDLEPLGYVDGQWSMVNKEESNKIHHSALPIKKESSDQNHSPFTVASSSIRRIAQWLHRYPGHTMENLRGNVNTRLRKVSESNWNGAIFAAAGLERILVRPKNSIDLDWMLPAPAQGAIMVVCRHNDMFSFDSCQAFNDEETALCTKIERDFLKTLLGGCSTPISALATIQNGEITLLGNIVSPDGKKKAEIKKTNAGINAGQLGMLTAKELLVNGGKAIADGIRNKNAI